MNFIDEVSIEVSSGKGGAGKVSFRRESMLPRGGPDGGDGGRGGHVMIRADRGINTLLFYRYKKTYGADDGEPGGVANRTGADGKDLVLKVPVGTVVKNAAGEILYDFTQEEELVICRGGKGGKGNTFYKSSVNQAPGVAQKGLPGEALHVKLELKLLADVGLVGFPNAGKSTLISKISAARPKVADYPFTTLVPHLGVVRLFEEKTCVVADIPGLIPGAHKGAGLGIQFLKHIERTRVFIHLIETGPLVERDPIDSYKLINAELSSYDRLHAENPQYVPLSTRPQIVVINKTDLIDGSKKQAIRSEFKDIQPIFISAATGEGLDQLKESLGRQLF